MPTTSQLGRTNVGLLLVMGLLLGACAASDATDKESEAVAAANEATETDSNTADASQNNLAGPDGSPPRSPANWTVLVYLMGDNDLEPFAVGDLYEMAESGSNENVNIVTLVDRHSDYSDLEFGPLDDFADTKIVHMGRDEVLAVEELGEVNTGRSSAVAEFIEYGTTNFPADKYGLILWDHGAGWPGLGPDETDDDDLLTIPELVSGISSGLRASGLEQLDLIGFDACLMAAYEVAVSMAPLAEVMVASQELEPGHGWDFASLDLLRETDASALTLGAHLADTYVAQADERGTNSKVTLSVVSLDDMDNLNQAVRAFGDALVNDDVGGLSAFASARDTALAFGASPYPATDAHVIDLGDMMQKIADDRPELSAAAGDVIAALDTAVTHTVSGFLTESASGLSVYAPPARNALDTDYFASVDSAWARVLTAFFEQGDAASKASAASIDQEYGVSFEFGDGGVFATARVASSAQETIGSAKIAYGIVDESDGSTVLLGEEPAAYIASGPDAGTVNAFYDLTVLTMSDGLDTDYAYLDADIDDDGNLYVNVPLWYVPPGERESETPPHDLVLSLVVDANGDVISEIYYEVGDEGTIGELTADPDGIVFPVVPIRDEAGGIEWVTLSEVGLYAQLDDIAYDLEPLPSGTELLVELVVYDVAGNSAAATGRLVVP